MFKYLLSFNFVKAILEIKTNKQMIALLKTLTPETEASESLINRGNPQRTK